MSKLITVEALIVKLRVYIAENHKTQLEFAKFEGVTPSYVSAVMVGKKAMPKKWFEMLGYEKQKQVLYKSK